MKALYKLVNSKKNALKRGDIISKRGGYEKEVAIILGATYVNKKFYDIKIPKICEKIELKKGSQYWLNEITYAQMILDNCTDVVTIFLKPGVCKKQKVLKKIFIVVNPKKIYELLDMDKKYCISIVNRAKNTGKALCFQHPLKNTEVEEIADYVIDLEK